MKKLDFIQTPPSGCQRDLGFILILPPPLLSHLSQQNTSLQVRASLLAAAPMGAEMAGRRLGSENLPVATASRALPLQDLSAEPPRRSPLEDPHV